MADLKSPYPNSDEESEDDDQFNEGEDDYDQDEYDHITKQVPQYPDHKALTEFHATVTLTSLDWKENADKIFSENPVLARQSDLNGKTILHLLIDSYVDYMSTARTSKASDILSAVARITRFYPELVQVRDSLDQDPGRVSGVTPLYSAIASGHPRLIDRIVDYCKPNKARDGAKKSKKESKRGNDHPLSQAMAVVCSFEGCEENALHFAMRRWPSIVKPPTLEKLVKRATDASVAAVDKLGYTPLHYAVDYS